MLAKKKKKKMKEEEEEEEGGEMAMVRNDWEPASPARHWDGRRNAAQANGRDTIARRLLVNDRRGRMLGPRHVTNRRGSTTGGCRRPTGNTQVTHTDGSLAPPRLVGQRESGMVVEQHIGFDRKGGRRGGSGKSSPPL